MKKLLFLLILVPSLSHAVDLFLPGSIWLKGDYCVNNVPSDVKDGRIEGLLTQGVSINRNVLFGKISVYKPLWNTDNQDNFYAFGLKHVTKLGLEFGIEKEYVRYSSSDVSRYVVFTEFNKEWGK